MEAPNPYPSLSWSRTHGQTWPCASFGVTNPSGGRIKDGMPPAIIMWPRSSLLVVGACTCLRGWRKESGCFMLNATRTKHVTLACNKPIYTSKAFAFIDFLHEVPRVTCGPFAEVNLQMAFLSGDDTVDGVPSHPWADGCQSHLRLNAATQMAETNFIQKMQHEKANVHSDDQGIDTNRLSNRAPNIAIKWVVKSLVIICDNVRERLKKTNCCYNCCHLPLAVVSQWPAAFHPHCHLSWATEEWDWPNGLQVMS